MAELANTVDFQKIADVLEFCCKTTEECGKCQNHKCLIGFGKMVTKYAQSKNIYFIPQGEEMVPRNDYKVYEHINTVQALAETCFQCKNCHDNHENNCSVSLIRNSLENALLGQNVTYMGSASLYVMEVAKLDQTIGGQFFEAFQTLKATR